MFKSRTILLAAILISTACAEHGATVDGEDNAAADEGGTPARRVECTLEIRSLTFDAAGEITADNVEEIAVSESTTAGPDGALLALPSLIVTGEILEEAIQGDGPLATHIRSQAISVLGSYMSRNTQGDEINNAQLSMRGQHGEQLSTAIGVNVRRTQTQLEFENATEHHLFDLTCIAH